MYFFYYLPVGLDRKLQRFPSITYLSSIVLVGVFLTVRYGAVRLGFDPFRFVYSPAEGGLVIAVASAFVHFGYVHLIGNVAYVLFFGRYVEDGLGSFRFALVFLSAAAVGNYLQGSFNTMALGDPTIGIVGASGAVSGLMGVFAVRFLRARIDVAYWVFLPLQAYARGGKASVPALIAIVLWFGLQLLMGLLQVEGAATQVAYVTHIAGFLWGIVLALGFGQYGTGRVEALLRDANRYLKRGEPYAAQGSYIRYLSNRPEDARVYASLARSLVMTRSREAADKNYRRAVELLIGVGERGEAEKVFCEALRNNGGFSLDPQCHLDLAFGLERDLKPDLALRAYENFVLCHPDHKEAPFTLLRAATICLGALDAEDRADRYYRRLIRDYPDDIWVDFAREQVRNLERTRDDATESRKKTGEERSRRSGHQTRVRRT